MGFEIIDMTYPKNIAADIPPAAFFMPPMNAPIIPNSSTASFAPFAKLYPNPVRGTVAPLPAKSTKYS